MLNFIIQCILLFLYYIIYALDISAQVIQLPLVFLGVISFSTRAALKLIRQGNLPINLLNHCTILSCCIFALCLAAWKALRSLYFVASVEGKQHDQTALPHERLELHVPSVKGLCKSSLFQLVFFFILLLPLLPGFARAHPSQFLKTFYKWRGGNVGQGYPTLFPSGSDSLPRYYPVPKHLQSWQRGTASDICSATTLLNMPFIPLFLFLSPRPIRIRIASACTYRQLGHRHKLLGYLATPSPKSGTMERRYFGSGRRPLERHILQLRLGRNHISFKPFYFSARVSRPAER